jgi:hypothetical protein
MTEKKSITITGGDRRDSTCGIGTVTSNRGAVTSASLAALRTALGTHAEGIIAVIDLFSRAPARDAPPRFAPARGSAPGAARRSRWPSRPRPGRPGRR